ncbi:MAG: hypothetical protein JSS91_01145 [Bacteroidetes bacterium]|nr:hypothetical protein [Bacteroidota bacterium]
MLKESVRILKYISGVNTGILLNKRRGNKGKILCSNDFVSAFYNFFPLLMIVDLLMQFDKIMK